MREFYGWIHNKVSTVSHHDMDNGILYLKGGDLEEEMNELKRPYQLYSLTDFFEEEFFETKKVVYVPVH
jgi:16S rRNA (guanine527-N7)-methyltransferase